MTEPTPTATTPGWERTSGYLKECLDYAATVAENWPGGAERIERLANWVKALRQDLGNERVMTATSLDSLRAELVERLGLDRTPHWSAIRTAVLDLIDRTPWDKPEQDAPPQAPTLPPPAYGDEVGVIRTCIAALEQVQAGQRTAIAQYLLTRSQTTAWAQYPAQYPLSTPPPAF